MVVKSREEKLKSGAYRAVCEIEYIIDSSSLSLAWAELSEVEMEQIMERMKEIISAEMANSLYEDPLF